MGLDKIQSIMLLIHTNELSTTEGNDRKYINTMKKIYIKFWSSFELIFD